MSDTGKKRIFKAQTLIGAYAYTLLYTRFSEVERGTYWFNLVRPSVRL